MTHMIFEFEIENDHNLDATFGLSLIKYNYVFFKL